MLIMSLFMICFLSVLVYASWALRGSQLETRATVLSLWTLGLGEHWLIGWLRSKVESVMIQGEAQVPQTLGIEGVCLICPMSVLSLLCLFLMVADTVLSLHLQKFGGNTSSGFPPKNNASRFGAPMTRAAAPPAPPPPRQPEPEPEPEEERGEWAESLYDYETSVSVCLSETLPC